MAERLARADATARPPVGVAPFATTAELTTRSPRKLAEPRWNYKDRSARPVRCSAGLSRGHPPVQGYAMTWGSSGQQTTCPWPLSPNITGTWPSWTCSSSATGSANWVYGIDRCKTSHDPRVHDVPASLSSVRSIQFRRSGGGTASARRPTALIRRSLRNAAIKATSEMSGGRNGPLRLGCCMRPSVPGPGSRGGGSPRPA